MSTERPVSTSALSSQRQYTWPLPRGTLKRKLGLPVPTVRQGELTYPSPPMSSPPSPRQPPQQASLSAASESTSAVAHGIVPGITLSPGQVAIAPTTQPPPPPPPFPSYVSNAPTFTAASGAPLGAQIGSVGILHDDPRIIAGPATVTTGLSAGSPQLTRTGRKSKAHVASACINCKRAHLSCDVQRPCARCVASGKQDTCFDLQHKKRGRPRLREESEFKVEQMLTEPGPRPPVPAPATPSTASRPITGVRHRRTESLRSIRSQTSDGSSGPSLPTPGFPQAPMLQAPFTYQQPPPPSAGLSAAQIPTAYLDLDFIFIKANRPFEQIIYSGQEIRGRQLTELAAPADGESFQAIRNRLRSEREAREPAYMPPILQAGQDPLQGVTEADVERLTQGFADYTHLWTRNRPGSPPENFPIRIRLAKATIYFVVVTLPSFRPALPPQPPPVAPGFVAPPPFATSTPFPQERRVATQSAPPSHYYPFPSTVGPPPPQQPSGGQLMQSRTYPPPQPGMPHLPQPGYTAYQYSQPPATPPRLPIAEPPTETSPFAPRSAAREVAQLPGVGVQLAPIIGGPAGPVEPSGTRPRESRPQQVSSSEEDGESGESARSPKKRRRMGIGDVLQQ